jgi:hypothetical protein
VAGEAFPHYLQSVVAAATIAGVAYVFGAVVLDGDLGILKRGGEEGGEFVCGERDGHGFSLA